MNPLLSNRSCMLSRFGLALGVAGALLATGCNNAPRGDTGNRVDTRERTRADARDTQADSVTLIEFSDQVAQTLAAKIAQVPEIRNSAQKVVIEMGDLENHTRTPKSDFMLVQRKIFITLTQSDIIRDHADILEPAARMDRQKAGISQPTTVDPTGRTVPQPDTSARYDPNLTYFLQGTFNEIVRGGGVQSTYNFDFTLTNAASRRIVIGEQITPKQVR